jgi:small subunit ribosomal protein S16
MVVIRMARGGAKKRPYYRVVVADQRFARNGRFIEQVGIFHPLAKENQTRLDLDRIDHWVSKGAQPSERVGQIVKRYRAAQPAEAGETA